MFITKSLFTNFYESPQLARWAIHDKNGIFKKIQEKKYGAMDGLAIGQEVENAVLQTLQEKSIMSIDNKDIDRTQRHQSYHTKTQEILTQNIAGETVEVIYQPGFLYKKLFCKCDLLVKNKNGTYDLWEVKAKNSVRKNTKEKTLLENMRADISFQYYVLTRSLGDKFSGKCYFIHLNKNFVKNGTIDYHNLLLHDEVIASEIIPDCEMEQYFSDIKTCSQLSKQEQDTKYPFRGGDYLTYYGKETPDNSVFTIPHIWRVLPDLVKNNINTISDIKDITTLYTKKGETTTASRYVALWQQEKNTIIDHTTIQDQLSQLEFPLYFYDYETVATPLPLFEDSSPWQQVVVQYSCHRIDEDGKISHSEAIIGNTEQTNERIIKQLVSDLNFGKQGSYIVWYKGFENSRNKELAKQYPQYAEALLAINKKTFDLMEVFSSLNYFDKRFKGSSSIKKVLPILTTISYDTLEVQNGAIAASLLSQLAKGIQNEKEADLAIKNLLIYCEQDTWAMVAIYQHLLKSLHS